MNKDIFITNQQYVEFRRTTYIFPTFLQLEKKGLKTGSVKKYMQRENRHIFVAI
jgi:hypothetical protein